MLFHVDELKDAGVTSLKLEGRMKRPEYVAAMTRAYRMAIDGATETDLSKELALMRRIFDRGADTGDFYGADVPANARGELFSDDAVLDGLRETYRGERRKRPVDGRLELVVGQRAALTLTLDGREAAVRGDIVQAAKKAPDTQRYIAQIARLGDTPFELRDCALAMSVPAFVSVSALNEMRRQAVEALYDALHIKRATPVAEMPALPEPEKAGTGEVLAVVPDAVHAAAAFQAGADIVALELRRMGGARGSAALSPFIPATSLTRA
jgi:putative protease